MAVKYFEFEDGQRLPGDRVKEFLMNQAVIQVDNPTELINSGVEAFGVKVAFVKSLNTVYVHATIAGVSSWTPLSNIFVEEFDYGDFTARLNAEGLFLTQDDKDELSGETEIAYQAALTAQGLALTADNKATGAVNTANLTAQGLTVTNQNVSGLDGRVTTAESNLTATNLTLTTTTNTANSASSRVNAITDISAGEIVVRKGPVVKAINGTTNETTIDGGTITTNSINVNRLQAGTLTGFRVQTSSSGQRVVMSESTNSLAFFNSGNTEVGRLTGLTGMTYDTPANHALQVNGATVFSVNSAGCALSPGASFNSNVDVVGRVYASGTVQSGNGAVILGTTGNVTANGNVTSDGFVSSGGVVQVTTMNGSTTNPIVRWSGGSRVALTVGGTSDERIKTDIQPVQNALEKLNEVNVITYRSRLEDEDDEKRVGVVAQQIEQIDFDGVSFIYEMPTEGMENLPQDFVGESIKLVNYEGFIPYLIKSIQELSAKNDALEARIAALEGGAQ